MDERERSIARDEAVCIAFDRSVDHVRTTREPYVCPENVVVICVGVGPASGSAEDATGQQSTVVGEFKLLGGSCSRRRAQQAGYATRGIRITSCDARLVITC